MGRGWEIQNRTHFDEIVANYDRTRLEYPANLISDIFNYAHADNSKKALEIGAGTGKATKSFLDAGYDVTAVEIGSNMAGFLKERFRQYQNLDVINDSFEKIPLENDKYDLIYAASAFHWVDAEIGCPKALRLLKCGGTLALFRYNAVPDDGEKLYEKIQTIYEKYFHKPYVRPAKTTREEYEKPTEIFKGFRFNDLKEYGFADVIMKFYDETKVFGADDYISLLDTMADHRSLANGDRAALYSGIREAILNHGGQIHVDYVFQLYMGRKCD
jgi:Dimethyladenosine transferase (rRNA methylation)